MRVNFGAFLAPHHLPGESPTLQIQRDLDLVALRDLAASAEPTEAKSGKQELVENLINDHLAGC